MTDLELGPELQPIWTGNKNYRKVDDQDEREQLVRLKSIDKTYNITSDYQEEQIPNKIEKEIRDVARELDFIDSVVDIVIERDQNIYRVDVKLAQSENIDISLGRI